MVDAHAVHYAELACLLALRAELEQERAVDRRQHLYSRVTLLRDDDSLSIVVDRNSNRIRELTRLATFFSCADGEQEREIGQ